MRCVSRAPIFGTLSLLSLLATLGCASTTTVKPVSRADGSGYEIECIRLGECWQEARRACHGQYQTVQQDENTIPESELPGMNALTSRNTGVRNGFVGQDPGMVPSSGPGIESRDPLPLAHVVVFCTPS
jgi:hypothetical protein